VPELKPRRIREALRSPCFLAAALCLCLLLGFFLGSLRVRSRSAEVTVISRAPAEEIRAVPGGQVNINTADKELLQTLPGIGPALAARIVAYREENGGFRFLYELTNVKGIGSSTFEALQELITLGPEE
jgi:competence protein ComEA